MSHKNEFSHITYESCHSINESYHTYARVTPHRSHITITYRTSTLAHPWHPRIATDTLIATHCNRRVKDVCINGCLQDACMLVRMYFSLYVNRVFVEQTYGRMVARSKRDDAAARCQGRPNCEPPLPQQKRYTPHSY